MQLNDISPQKMSDEDLDSIKMIVEYSSRNCDLYLPINSKDVIIRLLKHIAHLETGCECQPQKKFKIINNTLKNS